MLWLRIGKKTLKNIGGNRGIAPGQARLRTFGGLSQKKPISI
jgi:hypothetical protein